MPKISILMSTKDTPEEMLNAAIQSILKQSFTEFELIIICDGGKSDLKIVQSYDDSRINVIVHDETIGLTKSLNEALKIAKGDYIARMDSDDISLKDRLKVQYSFLERHKDIDICSTYAKLIGDRNSLVITTFTNPEEVKTNLLFFNSIIHSSVMMRKKFLEENSLFYNEKFVYSQDYELWTRCCFMTKMAIIPKVEILYRVHKNQISSAKAETQNRLCNEIYTRNLNRLGVEDIEQSIKCLNYLNGKNKNCTMDEMQEFIKTVIECNDKSGVYDKDVLEKELISLFLKIYVIRHHRLLPFRFMIKKRIIRTAVKRVFLELKFRVGVIFGKYKESKTIV